MSLVRGFTASLLLVAACNGKDDTGDTSVSLTGPSMEHAEIEESFAEGEEIQFEVSASDEEGVKGVSIFFRSSGSDYWNNRPLTGEVGVELWTIALSGEEVGAPGLEYYFRAEDLGIVSASSYLPLLGPEEPFSIVVEETGLALPYFVDFEAESLFDLGWVNVWHGFGGYPWRITDVHTYSGENAVVHQRGLEGGAEMDDWLITPALDFSGTDEVQVGWREYGTSISDLSASLWISTGSRDPGDGEFVEVTPLEPVTGADWVRAPTVDLSVWGGEPQVFLAWRYLGIHAGDWYLDDVAVQSLACDLDLALSWPAGPFAPGETIEVTATLTNRVEVACGALEVGLSAPDGGGTADPQSVSLTSGLEAPEDVVFSLAVDSDFLNHSYLPIQLDVSDGSESWSLEDEILVGLASTGRLEITTLSEGNIQVRIGVGDPEAPMWEESVHSSYENAGTLELSFDLTERSEWMPPGPGEDRWFARITTDADAYLDVFEIEYAGEITAASNLSNWYGPGSGLSYVPDPPSPILVQTVINPSTASPGSTGIAVDLVVYNEGAESAGVVQASLVSSDSDVTVQNPGPVSLADPIWSGSSAVAIPQTFLFDVSANHTDSTAVDLELLVEELDATGATVVGSWSLPISVEVPWPVLKATAIVIDDSSGNGDGLLDPGETVDLEVDVRNIGGLATFSTVSGELVVGAGSGTVASTSGATGLLGNLSTGITRTGTFDLALDAAATSGELLDLSLELSDGTQDYSLALELVVGERPWVAFSAVDDATEDHYESSFDLLNGFYRTDGTTMEFLFEAAEEFVSTSAFVEAWLVASGGPYSYYRLVLQGGVAQLQGYASGFTSLPAPTVDSVDSTRIKVSWPIADMQLATTSLRVGLGAGWCGTETGSFCDHFPDNWGYYYHSTYNSSGFFDVDW